jgi:FixJ family two-component response regulator
MPDKNGKELLDRILKIRPGLKCLFVSGYTSDTISRHGVLEEGMNFLEKPYTIKEIAQKVNSALSA